jgi:hypothetical protein
MTFDIEFSPELERRLLEEAARRGQEAKKFLQAIVEEKLGITDSGADLASSSTPEQVLAEFFTRFPRRSPDDLLELAREQGIQPVTRFGDLIGEGPADQDEFDVDAFLLARRQWQGEGRELGVSLVEPKRAHQ